jgi:protein gp37
VADRSGIEWTDATWNPVTGCTKVSPGCDNCYAETFAERFRGVPGHHFEAGFDLTLRPGRLNQPLRWARPRRVFVNSMSDLFHAGVPDEFIARVFAVMALADQHTFQLLTKRHARLRALLTAPAFPAAVAAHADGELPGWPLPNVWVGVSVEDQRRADLRVPALLDTPAAVRWVSAEPLLGPLDLTHWLAGHRSGCSCLGCFNVARGTVPAPAWWGQQHPLGWVVAGGESGARARPMHPGWPRTLRDQCAAAGVPFLFKQWGGRTPKAGGRQLDGRTWDQYPDQPPERA